ncbi:MAG TPA: STAS domain-containing protein [Gaiellaceae bacterium]|jgi:anti-anti-sigma factor|nr:STAS domain-containing protein [Gaiellaceae bacterium]
MNDGLLTVQLDRSERALIIRLAGEIDLSNAEQVQRRLESATDGCSEVVMDLSQVEYLDSRGLRLIKQICNKAEREGAGLRLVAPPGSVARQVLELARMHDYVEIRDSLEG